MSVLNLGAQAVGLMRSSTDIEGVLQNCSGLKTIRKLNEENPGLEVKEKVLASVQPCKDLLSEMFSRMTYSGIPLQMFQAASLESIDNLWSNMNNIDTNLSRSDTTRVVVQNKAEFQEFYKKHCLDRHYMFSVKKCTETECKFHQAPRIPDFDKVHHIPDPIPDGEHYKPFSELYGTETTGRYRPSLTTRANPDEGIPFVVSKQTALNVGQVIQCDECGKWRLVHANAKLQKTEIDLLCNVLSEISYSCGTSLQNGEATETGVLQSVYVRKDITCQSNIEIPYYSAKYEDICICCGTTENLETAENKEFYPRCNACKAAQRTLVKRRTRAFKSKEKTA